MEWVRIHESFFQSNKPVECPLVGVPVSLMIHTDKGEIQPDQLQALERFLEIPAEMRQSLLEPLAGEYKRVYDIVGKGSGPSGTPEQVWRFVSWKQILIPEQGPRGRRFVFLRGEPDWEQEHGVELFFRDEKLVRLHQASGAFLSSCFWDWG